jgi:hypothetical protein
VPSGAVSAKLPPTVTGGVAARVPDSWHMISAAERTMLERVRN